MFLLYSIILTLSVSFSSPQQNKNVALTINGVNGTEGVLVIDVFTSEKGFPMKGEKAFKRYKVQISAATISTSFSLPEGEYAMMIFHDVDNNGEIKTNFLGMPKEGVAASNNAKGSMGPPKFEDAKFKVGKDPIKLSVTLRYL